MIRLNQDIQRKRVSEAVTRMDNTRNTLQLTVLPFSSVIQQRYPDKFKVYVPFAVMMLSKVLSTLEQLEPINS
ncbi:hypothetical protein MAR_021720 [Mya arenaria]|uniref:Uncharacterized protein n=1 Tax=Mya arenaria TaxID=6604 RepID=A0ABY7EBT7_MYAAR|nr:hypothetical protein MAR_021720 [Mya arenaria]